ARTRLLLQAGAVPEHMPFLIRRLHALGRGAFYHGYRRAYERLRPIDTALVDRWEAVRAADRLFEGIPEERPTLLGIVERHARAPRQGYLSAGQAPNGLRNDARPCRSRHGSWPQRVISTYSSCGT